MLIYHTGLVLATLMISNGYIIFHINRIIDRSILRKVAHSWFNSYAPELVPIFYYRDKTLVHMIHFLINVQVKSKLAEDGSSINHSDF